MTLRSARTGLVAMVIIGAIGCDDAYELDLPDWSQWPDEFTAQPLNSEVHCLIVYDGAVHAGGLFTRAGATTVNGLARWDGASWTPLANGVRRRDCSTTFCNAEVNALTVWNDQLVAAGRFTVAGGEPALCVAAWDGTFWHAFGSGLNGRVHSVVSYRGQLIAGGDFVTSGDGAAVRYLAAWDGAAWVEFARLDGPVSELATAGDDLFIAGDFTLVNTIPIPSFARWNGGSWMPGGSNAIGALLSGGENCFMSSYELVRWNGEQWVDMDLRSASAVCSYDATWIASIRLDGPHERLVQSEGDGPWTAISSTLDGRVRALVAHEGAVYVGGAFQHAGQTASPFIARLPLD